MKVEYLYGITNHLSFTTIEADDRFHSTSSLVQNITSGQIEYSLK